MPDLEETMNNAKVIAAVRSEKEFISAVKSKAEIIFLLSPNIETLKKYADAVHKTGKRLFIHLDLAEGIGKDEYGIRFAKEQGADGIISTRSGIIKLAKKEGLFAVQRFFIIDSQSVKTTIESAKASKADMIEIMPAIVTKVIKKLKDELEVPVVAGGLIETAKEIEDAISSGAFAVSTGKEEFWN